MVAETSKKDAWDKADIIAKGLAAIVVSGVIAFYTIFVQEENRLQQSLNQEENRKVQTLIQLINSRAKRLTRICAAKCSTRY